MSDIADMIAFDQLTPAIRERLSSGARNMSASLALKYLVQGIAEARILDAIDRNEANIIDTFNREYGR